VPHPDHYLGHGHSIDYFEKGKVTVYIAVEPNVRMHARLRARANAAGFSESNGTLLILPNGLEDTDHIKSSLPDPAGVDTIISVLTLCSVPNPQAPIQKTVKGLLKPGGQFLFYEHVLSKYQDVAWWQRFWAPVWAIFFDGCRIDRATEDWLAGLSNGGEPGSMWEEKEVWVKEGQSEMTLFYHRGGRFVKCL
jgi:SAM-dependent methyltransferase